jgi:hypothetical protein
VETSSCLWKSNIHHCDSDYHHHRKNQKSLKIKKIPQKPLKKNAIKPQKILNKYLRKPAIFFQLF